MKTQNRASENAKLNWITVIVFTLVCAIVFSLSSCKKETVQSTPQVHKWLEGTYQRVDSVQSDNLQIVFEYYQQSGVCPNSVHYNFIYPDFGTACNYSVNSTHPVSKIKLLGENDYSDIIETVDPSIGDISGYLQYDTLYLDIRPFNGNIHYQYKYLKL